MNWKNLFTAVKKGIGDFFSDDEEFQEGIEAEEEIEISLKGLFIFVALIIVLGLGIYGVRQVMSPSSGVTDPSQQAQSGQGSQQAGGSGAEAEQPPAPIDPELIRSLPPIDFLDIGSEQDERYLILDGYRDREPYPITENDSTFRWTQRTARMFFPFPKDKKYTSLDFLLTVPPEVTGSILVTINGKQYEKKPIDRAVPHYTYPLEAEHLTKGYLDIVLTILDIEKESGVQLLHVKLIEESPSEKK